MSLVALCYPKVPERHQRFMDQLREKHDLAFKDVVRPHFTLVFPLRGVSDLVYREHIQTIAARREPFPFVCRYAMVHSDPANDNWYVFLVPDEGFSRIARLHDELYTGVLAPHLRLDLPYLPHIGVATFKDRTACRRLADELNRNGPEVSGVIDAISVGEYDGKVVADRYEIRLADGAGQQDDCS